MNEHPPALPPPPPVHRLHVWQFQAVRDLLIITGLVLLVWAGYWLRAITVPLLIALTLAYLMDPIVRWLCDRTRWGRPGVVAAMVGVLALMFLLIVGLIVPLLVFQTIDLVRSLPDIANRVQEFARERLPEDAIPWLTGEQAQLWEQIEEWLRANIASVFRVTVERTSDALALIAGLVGSTIYIAFLLFLIPFYFFYFSAGWPRLRDWVHGILPPGRFPRGYELLGKMDRAVSGFVRGRIVISLIMGMLLSIGWGLVGVPYWLVVGMATGLFCAVPYLGGIGVPVAIVLLWLDQSGAPAGEGMAWWGIILWPVAVFAVVQLIEGYILTPVIAGKSTNLGPVSILVAVLAGGAVAGVYGMLLAIPFAACVKILATDLLVPRVRDWAEGRAADILPLDGP